MIPLWLAIEAGGQSRRRFRLRLPLPVIYLILLPFVLLLLPVMVVVCLLRGINPFRVIYAVFVLSGSLSGTHVEVRQANSSFLISIM
jgi:hypothetical protein